MEMQKNSELAVINTTKSSDCNSMCRRFYTVNEIAHYLGISNSTVRKWIRSAKIPFSRLNGGIRFDIQVIEQWAKKNSEKAING